MEGAHIRVGIMYIHPYKFVGLLHVGLIGGTAETNWSNKTNRHCF